MILSCLGAIFLPTSKSNGKYGKIGSPSLVGITYIFLGITDILKWYYGFCENDTCSEKKVKYEEKGTNHLRACLSDVTIVDILVNFFSETSMCIYTHILGIRRCMSSSETRTTSKRKFGVKWKN